MENQKSKPENLKPGNRFTAGEEKRPAVDKSPYGNDKRRIT